MQPLPQEVLLLVWRVVDRLVKEVPDGFAASRDQSSHQLHLGTATAAQRRHDAVLEERVSVSRQSRDAIITHHERRYKGRYELTQFRRQRLARRIVGVASIRDLLVQTQREQGGDARSKRVTHKHKRCA